MFARALFALIALSLPLLEGPVHHPQDRLLQTRGRGGGHHNKSAKPKEITLQGTVQKANGAEMAVLSDKDQTVWLVASQPTTRVTTTGLALVDFLRAGMNVTIKAAVDADGYAKGKLGEMKLIGLKGDALPASAMPPAPVKGSGPAVPNEAAKVLAKPGAKATPSFEQQKEKEKAADSIVGPPRNLTGRLTGVKGTECTMQIPTGPHTHQIVRFELTEDAKINVSLAEALVARPGDKVEVKGKPVPKMANACAADEVKLTLTTPLAGKKRPTTATPSSSADASKPASSKSPSSSGSST